MPSKFLVAAATVAAMLFPTVASAETSGAARGYKVRATPSGRVCLRPTSEAEAVRFRIPIHQQECQRPDAWASEGLRIERVRPAAGVADRA